jgi:hypothetical protein
MQRRVVRLNETGNATNSNTYAEHDSPNIGLPGAPTIRICRKMSSACSTWLGNIGGGMIERPS